MHGLCDVFLNFKVWPKRRHPIEKCPIVFSMGITLHRVEYGEEPIRGIRNGKSYEIF